MKDRPLEKGEILSPIALRDLSPDELLNYIDRLHSMLKNYQLVIDFAVRSNIDVRQKPL